MQAVKFKLEGELETRSPIIDFIPISVVVNWTYYCPMRQALDSLRNDQKIQNRTLTLSFARDLGNGNIRGMESHQERQSYLGLKTGINSEVPFTTIYKDTKFIGQLDYIVSKEPYEFEEWHFYRRERTRLDLNDLLYPYIYSYFILRDNKLSQIKFTYKAWTPDEDVHLEPKLQATRVLDLKSTSIIESRLDKIIGYFTGRIEIPRTGRDAGLGNSCPYVNGFCKYKCPNHMYGGN